MTGPHELESRDGALSLGWRNAERIRCARIPGHFGREKGAGRERGEDLGRERRRVARTAWGQGEPRFVYSGVGERPVSDRCGVHRRYPAPGANRVLSSAVASAARELRGAMLEAWMRRVARPPSHVGPQTDGGASSRRDKGRLCCKTQGNGRSRCL